MQHNLSREIHVAVLPYRQLVRAGKQQDLFRSLELVEIAEILPIDPNAGSPFNLRRPFQLQLPKNLIGRVRQLSAKH